MKKELKTLAALRLVLTIVFCCAMTVTEVNAQQTESPAEKGERLAKAADAAPKDWQKQYDAAEFFLSPSGGSPDVAQAEKYATRALEIAKSQVVKRDTILGKSLELMAGLGINKNNLEQFIGYYDQAIRAYVDELGYKNAAIPPRIAFFASYKWMLYSMGRYGYGAAEAVRSLREALWLNEQLPEGQRAQGMDESETVLALSYEMLMVEQAKLMNDKVWQWSDKATGKTYTVLAFHSWTLEQPAGFMATLFLDMQSGKDESGFQRGFVLMDEQGNITERPATDVTWNVNFNQKGIAFRLQDSTNLRVVSIPADKRQQIVDAFRKFEKKRRPAK